MKKDIYRARIKKSLDNKVLNYLSSFQDDYWIAKEDIIGTEAHDIMLFEQKILKKKDIKKILRALEELKSKFIQGNLELEGNFEDIHPFIEKYVINEVGIESGGKIHTGRSRNDQVSVDLRLKIRSELNKLSQHLFELIEVLLELSKDNIESYMPLYTHLQKAQLGVFSHYINYYISQILRIEERIDEVYRRVNKNPLGACAIGGTSVNINRERTAELLGFNGLIRNSIDAISSRDYILESIMLLSLLASHFSRISEDLMLWSTNEFNFIELADEFCSVSSVMPQKKNPDSLELSRAKSSIVISNVLKASLIVKAIPSGYLRDFQELKPILKESFNHIHSITEIFTGIFSTLYVNKEMMLEKINDSYILALDLAEILVNDYEIPFRIAHSIIGKLVSISNKPEDLFDIHKIKNLAKEMGSKDLNLSHEVIDKLKDHKYTLNRRKSKGSPSKKEINEFTYQLEEKKEFLYDKYNLRVEKIKIADSLRKETIKEILS
ncbi:MAG: argininosuccinate lyase [Promethearchaeota archaeon]|nr:MAG: argininosuccinate lyase [Candidatus Lokiarchaeota archaeon]